MQCKYQQQGKPTCQSNAMHGKDFCFTHDPESREAHIRAASKGGAAVPITGELLPPIAIERISDVTELLKDTVNRVRMIREDGTMDIKVANCVGYLSGLLIKAIEVSEIANRLEIVERVIFERKSLTKK